MNATQLLQEIQDSNAIQTLAAFEVENETHEIDIFFSQSVRPKALIQVTRNVKLHLSCLRRTQKGEGANTMCSNKPLQPQEVCLQNYG